MRKLTYFIACSIDGFIGDPSGEAELFTRFVDEEYFEFLKTEYPETLPTHGRRALGVDDLENKKFDTIIQPGQLRPGPGDRSPARTRI